MHRARSHRLRSSRATWATALLALTACGVEPLAPVALPSDAGPHSRDAAPADASPIADGSTVVDAGVDAGGGTDASLSFPEDAGDPCAATCIAEGPCEIAECRDGRCVRRQAPLGQSCGERDGEAVCVDGACVVRTGCGDGYREPGPTPARESCDDGRDDPEDACSEDCAARPFAISSLEEQSVSQPSVGVDDRGFALVAYVTVTGASLHVRARRLGSRGRHLAGSISLGSPMPLSAKPFPTVIGIDEGWLVAWATRDAEGGARVLASRIAPDGTVSPPAPLRERQDVSVPHESTASLTWMDDRVIAAWLRADPDGRYRIVTRVLSSDGTPTGPETIAATAQSPLGRPAIATLGARGLVAWSDLGSYDSPPRGIRAALLDLTTGIHVGAERGISSELALSPLVVPTETGGFVVTWTERLADLAGDARAVELDPESAEPVASAIDAAATPELAEQWCALTALHGGGALGLFARSTPPSRRLDDVVLSPLGATLPPEADVLTSLLAGAGTQQDCTATRGNDGSWVAWVDDSSGRPTLMAYLLPRR